MFLKQVRPMKKLKITKMLKKERLNVIDWIIPRKQPSGNNCDVACVMNKSNADRDGTPRKSIVFYFYNGVENRILGTNPNIIFGVDDETNRIYFRSMPDGKGYKLSFSSKAVNTHKRHIGSVLPYGREKILAKYIGTYKLRFDSTVGCYYIGSDCKV